MTPRYAVTYQRFSSERQINNSSLERQTDAQRAWLAMNKDVVVIDSFVDEAISAWNGSNVEKGSLGRLLQAIEDGFIPNGTLILVEQFSRLSRQNIDKTEELLRRIWAAGVTLVTVRDNQLYTPETINNLPQRIKLLVEIESAFRDSEWRSAKVRGSYEKREREAKLGIVPRMRRRFWLDKDGRLNEHHIAVKDIFNWYIDGFGQTAIIKKLRAKYPDEKFAQNMDPSSVTRIIKSEVAKGYWRDCKVYEPAVDEATFTMAQQVLDSRLVKNVQEDRQWPLRGLVICEICGGGMSIQQTGDTLPLFRCSNHRRSKSCSRKTATFPYSLVHLYMFNLVRKRASRLHTQRTVSAESTLRLGQIEKELNSLRGKLLEEKNTYKSYLEQSKNVRIFLELMAETDDAILELESEKAELQRSIKAQDKLFISKESDELVFKPQSFNVEMQKLKFKIVIGENTLNTIGFENNAPEWTYTGYCRKTKSYRWKALGKNYSYPCNAFTVDTLMLEDSE
ncbi:recombinase family protein [Enterovibrio sp. NIFS-20-8]|nr:recombinase family protein [Enterovibrio paralichthyis]MBV7300190.1 recombinase family protein [Enterovibrio paralichthyis]